MAASAAEQKKMADQEQQIALLQTQVQVLKTLVGHSATGLVLAADQNAATTNGSAPTQGYAPHAVRFYDKYQGLIDAFVAPGNDDLLNKLKDAVTRINGAFAAAQINVTQLQPLAYGFNELQDACQQNGAESDDLNVLQVFLNKVNWTKDFQQLRASAQTRKDKGPDWLL